MAGKGHLFLMVLAAVVVVAFLYRFGSLIAARLRGYLVVLTSGVRRVIPCSCLDITFDSPIRRSKETESELRTSVLSHLWIIGAIETELSHIKIESWDSSANETIVRTRINCEEGEACALGFGSGTIDVVELLQGCKDDVIVAGVNASSCRIQEDINVGTTCLAPPTIKFQNTDRNSPYEEEIALSGEGTSADPYRILEDAALNNTRANFNVAIKCAAGHSSPTTAAEVEGDVDFVLAECASSDSATSPYYSISESCVPNCTEPTIIPSGIMSPSIFHANESLGDPDLSVNHFNVRYNCLDDWSPASAPLIGEFGVATQCEAPAVGESAVSYRFPIDCIRDCTDPSEVAGDSPSYIQEARSDGSGNDKSHLNFDVNVICNDAANYAATRNEGGLHPWPKATVCGPSTGSTAEAYNVMGCELKCMEPNNVGLYAIPENKDYSRAAFNLSSDNVQCKEGDAIGVAASYICPDPGETFGLMGCFPVCNDGMDCLNMTITYPNIVDEDEDGFKDIIVAQLNGLDVENLFTKEDITHFNHMSTEPHEAARGAAGTCATGYCSVIEYQISCKFDECNVDRMQEALTAAGAGEGARVSGALADIAAAAQDPAAPFDPSPNSHAFIYGLNNDDGDTIAELRRRATAQLSEYNDQQVTLFEQLADLRWLVEVDVGNLSGHQLRINVDNLCPRVPIDGGCR